MAFKCYCLDNLLCFFTKLKGLSLKICWWSQGIFEGKKGDPVKEDETNAKGQTKRENSEQFRLDNFLRDGFILILRGGRSFFDAKKILKQAISHQKKSSR